MSGYLIIAVIGFWAALLQAGWISMFYNREPILFLPLVVVVLLISEFRRSDALVVALTAGLVLDAISSLPPGVNTILLVIGWLSAYFLFQRIFTNQSILATVGLQGTVFIIWSASLSIIRAIRATLFGWPWGEAGVWPTWWVVVIGSAAQALAAILFVFFRKLIRRRLTRGFIVTRQSERGWRK